MWGLGGNWNEKKRLDSGGVPSLSKLYRKLDYYGTDLAIPVIPFIEGRVSCTWTTVIFDQDFSFFYVPPLQIGCSSDALSCSTTKSGRVHY